MEVQLIEQTRTNAGQLYEARDPVTKTTVGFAFECYPHGLGGPKAWNVKVGHGRVRYGLGLTTKDEAAAYLSGVAANARLQAGLCPECGSANIHKYRRPVPGDPGDVDGAADCLDCGWGY